MATGMHMDERNVDCLVLGHHDKDRKVSAKSVTMRAMTLCKNLSGYRELLLIIIPHVNSPYKTSIDERLIFYNITCCYSDGEYCHVFAKAAGDIIKYQGAT